MKKYIAIEMANYRGLPIDIEKASGFDLLSYGDWHHPYITKVSELYDTRHDAARESHKMIDERINYLKNHDECKLNDGWVYAIDSCSTIILCNEIFSMDGGVECVEDVLSEHWIYGTNTVEIDI